MHTQQKPQVFMTQGKHACILLLHVSYEEEDACKSSRSLKTSVHMREGWREGGCEGGRKGKERRTGSENVGVRKSEPLRVNRDLISVKRDLISVERDPISVKRDLISVKRDLTSVQRVSL